MLGTQTWGSRMVGADDSTEPSKKCTKIFFNFHSKQIHRTIFKTSFKINTCLWLQGLGIA